MLPAVYVSLGGMRGCKLAGERVHKGDDGNIGGRLSSTVPPTAQRKISLMNDSKNCVPEKDRLLHFG